MGGNVMRRAFQAILCLMIIDAISSFGWPIAQAQELKVHKVREPTDEARHLRWTHEAWSRTHSYQGHKTKLRGAHERDIRELRHVERTTAHTQ